MSMVMKWILLKVIITVNNLFGNIRMKSKSI